MRWLWCEDAVTQTAARNMETDSLLLDRMREAPYPPPVVRVYTWSEPAVTAGRLQRIDDVRDAYPDLEVIARPTGGRAVLHGSDLTVTVAARETDLGSSSVRSSFRIIAQGIVDALANSGIPAAFGPDRRGAVNKIDCFAHTASCDIVDLNTQEKIAGCAQRRAQGAVLQQMSIPGFAGDAPFRSALRAAMAQAIGVEEWIFVDYKMALCYTDRDGQPP